MELLPFVREEHSEILRSWLRGHGLDETNVEELPEVGFIVEDSQGFIAAGFLRKVEAGFALLDGLIANPQASGKRRYRAIDVVVQKLIQKAKKIGFKQLFALSKDKATLKRSIRHGFAHLPEQVIGMQL